MRKADQRWVGRYVFESKGHLADPSKHWHHPPQKRAIKKHVPGEFFLQWLFVWAPRMAYKFDFKCPGCSRSLQSKGLYNRVRPVLDISSFYYLAAEYYMCGGCKMTLIAYDHRIMEQLPYVLRSRFPAVLTYKYACDRSVVSMLRSRTVGNSPSALQAMLLELHTENWLRKQTEYLNECLLHSKGIQGLADPESSYQKADGFKVIPKAKWFLAVVVPRKKPVVVPPARAAPMSPSAAVATMPATPASSSVRSPLNCIYVQIEMLTKVSQNKDILRLSFTFVASLHILAVLCWLVVCLPQTLNCIYVQIEMLTKVSQNKDILRLSFTFVASLHILAVLCWLVVCLPQTLNCIYVQIEMLTKVSQNKDILRLLFTFVASLHILAVFCWLVVCLPQL